MSLNQLARCVSSNQVDNILEAKVPRRVILILLNIEEKVVNPLQFGIANKTSFPFHSFEYLQGAEKQHRVSHMVENSKEEQPQIVCNV